MIQQAPAEVVDVNIVQGTTVLLRFKDGYVRELDLASLMTGPVFDQYLHSDKFNELVVDTELGTIAWPNGADLDPDVLRYGLNVDVAASVLPLPRALDKLLPGSAEVGLLRRWSMSPNKNEVLSRLARERRVTKKIQGNRAKAKLPTYRLSGRIGASVDPGEPGKLLEEKFTVIPKFYLVGSEANQYEIKHSSEPGIKRAIHYSK